MDFELSIDQVELATGIRALLAGELPLETLRTFEGAENVVDPDVWSSLAATGVFTFLVPEVDGGLGLGLKEAMVVAEEFGRALVPGPVIATMAAAPDFAPAAAGAGVAIVDATAPNSAAPLLIEHPRSIESVLVLPSMDDAGGEVRVVDAASLDLTLVAEPLDPLTPMATLARPIESGAPLEGASAVALRQRTMILLAAAQVGNATATTDLAVAYAKEREQFDRPIGSFQAIKHLLADSLCRAELARSALWAAAVMLDDPDVAAVEADTLSTSPAAVTWRAIAGAKSLADEAAITNARTAIQVYGGMGFTWEVPLHLYLKRARVASSTLGNRTQMNDLISALI
jgi:alkylation response protein AidB-like acyl-CoA dehydrogenase